MTYNMSGIDNSTTMLEWVVEANKLADKLPAHGILVVMFLAMIMLGIAITNDFKKSLLASSMACCVMSLILMFMQLCDWYFPILFGVGIVVGIIMLQDKDYST